MSRLNFGIAMKAQQKLCTVDGFYVQNYNFSLPTPNTILTHDSAAIATRRNHTALCHAKAECIRMQSVGRSISTMTLAMKNAVPTLIEKFENLIPPVDTLRNRDRRLKTRGRVDAFGKGLNWVA
jgi:hypothetical protein